MPQGSFPRGPHLLRFWPKKTPFYSIMWRGWLVELEKDPWKINLNQYACASNWLCNCHILLQSCKYIIHREMRKTWPWLGKKKKICIFYQNPYQNWADFKAPSQGLIYLCCDLSIEEGYFKPTWLCEGNEPIKSCRKRQVAETILYQKKRCQKKDVYQTYFRIWTTLAAWMLSLKQ